MKLILDSIARSKTVKRLIFTSSGCAGSVVDNDDDYSSIDDNAQCLWQKGKVECEKAHLFFWPQQYDIFCCSSCPAHVMGPILPAPLQDMMYQHRLGEMLGGKYCLDMNWEVCDVRDIAETQRLMFESSNARYCRDSASHVRV
jgi:nucleoside-diphosphate-sugar epimerase